MQKIQTVAELAAQFEAASKIYDKSLCRLANTTASFSEYLSVLCLTRDKIVRVVCALKIDAMDKTEEQQIQFRKALKSSGISFVKQRKPKSQGPPLGGGVSLRRRLANFTEICYCLKREPVAQSRLWKKKKGFLF